MLKGGRDDTMMEESSLVTEEGGRFGKTTKGNGEGGGLEVLIYERTRSKPQKVSSKKDPSSMYQPTDSR
jgi:hypothetical protein